MDGVGRELSGVCVRAGCVWGGVRVAEEEGEGEGDDAGERGRLTGNEEA